MWVRLQKIFLTITKSFFAITAPFEIKNKHLNEITSCIICYALVSVLFYDEEKEKHLLCILKRKFLFLQAMVELVN